MTSRRRRKKETPVTEAGIRPPVVTELEELRTKIGNIIADLVWDANDVALALAELECPDRDKCPLAKATKKLIKKLREMFEIQRELSKKVRTPPPSQPAEYT